MITYIMDYAKSEKILNSVHNRNVNRYINQHLSVIILEYGWVFSNCYKRANNMLIALLYMSIISVGPNNFDGAKKNRFVKYLFYHSN